MQLFKKTTLLTALFAFILSFSFSNANAQVKKKAPQSKAYTLQGKVVDAQSSNVLPAAEIAIVGKDVNTVTKKEGEFKLKNLPAGKHTVKVTLDGYQPWEKNVTIKEDAKLKIKLKPEK